MSEGQAMVDASLDAMLAGDASGWAREHIEHDVVAWLTTVSPDGQPQSSVISFLRDGDTILFYSRPDTPKLRNIARSPLVAFHLQADPYGDHVLTLEARAEVDPSAPSSLEHAAYRANYRGPLAHWGMDEAETARAFSVPVRLHPLRARFG